jgi:hypothetical protein
MIQKVIIFKIKPFCFYNNLTIKLKFLNQKLFLSFWVFGIKFFPQTGIGFGLFLGLRWVKT